MLLTHMFMARARALSTSTPGSPARGSAQIRAARARALCASDPPASRVTRVREKARVVHPSRSEPGRGCHGPPRRRQGGRLYGDRRGLDSPVLRGPRTSVAGTAEAGERFRGCQVCAVRAWRNFLSAGMAVTRNRLQDSGSLMLRDTRRSTRDRAAARLCRPMPETPFGALERTCASGSLRHRLAGCTRRCAERRPRDGREE